jgi:poly(3-hydroxybutyrate) depolymerase
MLDMSAEFYIETVDWVFQRDLLAQGQLTWQGQPVEPSAIRRTALLTVEGAKDDICGVGQTLAVQELCTGIRSGKKRHHLQPGVATVGFSAGAAGSGRSTRSCATSFWPSVR